MASASKKYSFLAPPAQPDEIGRLGKYRILGLLGEGGMGCVFRGEDAMLRRAVAIKVMNEATARDPANQERFLNEARAAANLRHDHIIEIWEVSEIDGMP